MTEICFHPEVLRAQSKPQVPFSTGLIWIMVTSIVVAVFISVYAEIEIISPTRGQIIPVGKVNTVRSATAGFVDEVSVVEGDMVNKGQVLIRFNKNQIEADIASTLFDLNDVQARISALTPYRDLSKIDKPVEYSNIYQEIAFARYQRLNNDIEDITEQINEYEADRNVINQKKTRFTKQLPLERKRLLANSRLQKNGYASEMDHLDQEVKLAQLESDIGLSRAESSSIEVKMKNLEKDKMKLRDSFMLTLIEELRVLSLDQVELEQQLLKLEELRRNTLVTSPIHGIVQELVAIDEGNYLEEGEVLLKVVPGNAAPIAEIMIPSKDIGFIHVGQNARVKVDAFSYTRYGSLPAEVSYISQDAVSDEEKLYYPAYLTLKETEFYIKGKPMQVQYGMSVKADIITGDRPLIDYFISPIKENINQALIER